MVDGEIGHLLPSEDAFHGVKVLVFLLHGRSAIVALYVPAHGLPLLRVGDVVGGEVEILHLRGVDHHVVVQPFALIGERSLGFVGGCSGCRREGKQQQNGAHDVVESCHNIWF